MSVVVNRTSKIVLTDGLGKTLKCLITLSEKPSKILYYTHFQSFKEFVRNIEINKKNKVVLPLTVNNTQPVQGRQIIKCFA